MREKRRLALVERQHVLAGIARREAMTALAEAISDEARSTALARRSTALAAEYRARIERGGGDGATLGDLARFSGALAGLSRDAEMSREDAARQASWQQDTLAAAETRMQRMDQRLDAARLDLDLARERRTQTASAPMARKLLKHRDLERSYAARKPR